MKSGLLQIKAFQVTDHAGLDPITVFYQDFEPGKGQITITCYGEAWTAYWGAMGKGILQFFKMADQGYLVNRLLGAQFQKRTKGHETYLGRIVDAIKEELKDEVQS